MAVLYRNYIVDILRGRKTVECRLGRLGFPPHGIVRAGDVLWLKEVSGPVWAAVRVCGVRTVRLTGPEALEVVRRKWNDRIGAPAAYWRAGGNATAATLILLGDCCSFQPFRVRKADRRAWVPLGRPRVPGRALCAAGR
ncbi:MAG: ASCH domain-containing protein [Planctomycetes bacterium]|nr:ASCH domain-containing protein [Planctomycetota bacterium]